MKTKTVRLSERVEEFEESLGEIEQEIEEIEEEAESLDVDSEKFRKLTERDSELQLEKNQTKKSIKRIEEFIEDECNGDDEFTLTELNMAQALHAENVATARSGNKDLSAEAMELLDQALVSSPDSAPDNPGNYPIVVGMYLYEQVGELMGAEGNSEPSLAKRLGKE